DSPVSGRVRGGGPAPLPPLVGDAGQSARLRAKRRSGHGSTRERRSARRVRPRFPPARAGGPAGRRRDGRERGGATRSTPRGHEVLRIERGLEGSGMKVLITGGTGFIGSHLAQAFLERGDHVMVLDTASTAKVLDIKANPEFAGRFQYVKGSVLDYTLLEGLMRKANLCYHLAAVVGVEHYVDHPFGVLG